ncbi:Protein of unknown function [Pyronema omphalodes CBS 100304]|uniref:Secreted protein n=1 Tax=Pyronema omphalodes (strain CBS 100304) TaxID=1076935 RepID=U4LM46_PYROM|nr:Protein of unknown function [Pyronema omphalodes CBS 100304]
MGHGGILWMTSMLRGCFIRLSENVVIIWSSAEVIAGLRSQCKCKGSAWSHGAPFSDITKKNCDCADSTTLRGRYEPRGQWCCCRQNSYQSCDYSTATRFRCYSEGIQRA